jgi:mannosyltransferase OCH1-like enzyme
MLINYDLRAIFFHNVKCGGNSVKDILKKNDFIETCIEDHENYINFVDDETYIKDIKDKHTIRKMGKYRYFYSHQYANKLYMENFFKFIFVRNPYTKIVSAYLYLKRRMKKDNNTIRGMPDNIDYFEDFNIFIKNYKNVNNISYFHAFICQYENIIDFSNNINFQYIGRLENITNDLDAIFKILNIENTFNNEKKMNESTYEKNIEDYYNEDSFHFVNTFFEKDFEIFGYIKYNTFEEFKNGFMRNMKNAEYNISNINNKINKEIPYYYIEIPSFIKKKEEIIDTQIIPRILIQTYKNNYLHPCVHNNIMHILSKNPSYDYYFINDHDAIKLIEDYFDSDGLNAFKKLKVGSAKGDFIRYIALYIYGGVYLDLDATINMDLNNFIQKNSDYYFLYENYFSIITNWFIAITPKHIIMKKIIEEMVKRINNNIENNILLITGPDMISCVIYNHFTNNDVMHGTELNIKHCDFLKFIDENNNSINHFVDSFYIQENNLINFHFPGYNTSMLYRNEVKYDNIINFNIYHELTENIDISMNVSHEIKKEHYCNKCMFKSYNNVSNMAHAYFCK